MLKFGNGVAIMRILPHVRLLIATERPLKRLLIIDGGARAAQQVIAHDCAIGIASVSRYTNYEAE